MDVEIDGLDQVQRMLNDVKKRARGGLKKRSLQAGGEYLQGKIKANVPVDDGVYRDGIEVAEKGRRVLVHTGKVPHEIGRASCRERV